MTKTILFICSTILFSSCIVTNNLYVNDPVPLPGNKAIGYIGLGTGSQPKVDSVSVDGDIYFSNQIKTSMNVCGGFQGGITDKWSGRAAIHLPKLLGGFGLRLGAQYSFFDTSSFFNMALGTDLGFILSRDSVRFFGLVAEIPLNYFNGAINADFFTPVSLRLGAKSRIIVTPRYSFNTIFIKQNINYENRTKFSPNLASLAVGLMIDRIYIEASIQTYEKKYYPNFGFISTYEKKYYPNFGLVYLFRD